MSDSPDHSARRDAYKKEGIAWCLSLIAAIATFIGLAFLVDRTYHPDTASAIERASELSIIHSSAFHPEPKEKALFLLGVVTIPLAFTGFYLLFRKVLTTFSSVTLRRLFAPILIVSLLTVVVAGYAGLMAANPFHLDAPNSHDEVALSNLQFYFIDTFLYVHPALYTFLFFPLAALLLWYREPLWQRLPPLAERVAGWLCYGWCGGLVVLVLTIHVFRFPYTYPNKYDFSAVYYSMVQVFGGVPLLVDGFTNTYGLYPHFLVPIFKLTGLSVLTFSGVMAVLDAICFGLLFLTLRRQLRSTGLLLCTFSAILFYAHFFARIITPFDSSFASQPIRFLFPVLSLSLAELYLTRRTPLIRTASLLVLAMGILWNPEFGTLTYAAFVVFLLAVELLGADRRRILGGMVSILSSAALCAIAVLSSYALAIRVTYGSFPELFKMFRTFRVFSELGFNMLPMPLIHPWNLIALVFILGLASFLVAVIGRTLTPRHTLILLVTIHGIGAFMYYQGRSHNWTLLGATTYAFILMAFFAESLRSAARDEGWYFLPWALIVFVLAGSVCQLTYAAPAISALVTEDANKVGSSGENMTIADNARFIRAHTQENEKVLILSRNYHQAYYYGFSHTVAAINPGLLDLFWREDYNRIVRFLASNKDVKIFFDPQGFARYNDMVDTVLSGMYEARSNNGRLWLLQKK